MISTVTATIKSNLVQVWCHEVWLWNIWQPIMFDVINAQPASQAPYLICLPQQKIVSE